MTYNTQQIERYQAQTNGLVRYRPAEPQLIDSWYSDTLATVNALMMTALHEGLQ